MKAIQMPTTNRRYVAEGCLDLPATVYKDGDQVYTECCFELDTKEISTLICTKKIYFTVLGEQIIPMMLHTESMVKEVSNEEN